MKPARTLTALVLLTMLTAAAFGQSTPTLNDPQKVESLRQDDLITFAPEKLMAIPAIGASAWSPDGSHIAFVSNLSGRQNLWLVPAAGGWPVQLTVSERPVRRPVWSPSGKFIAYESDAAGSGLPDLFVVKVENGEVTNLTTSPTVGEGAAAWSPDSRYLAWVAYRRDGTAEVETYDMLLRRRRSLTPNPPPSTHFLTPLWSPDGKSIAYTRITADGGSSIILAEVATGNTLDLTPHAAPERWRLGAFAPDGSRLLVTSSARNGHDNVALLDLKSKAVEWLTDEREARLQAGNFSPDGKLVTWTATANGNSALYLYNLAAKSAVEVAPPRGRNQWGGATSAFSPDGRQLLWHSDGPQSPASLWLYDLTSRQSRLLTPAFTGGLRAQDMVAPVLVRYPLNEAEAGIEARALVYTPYNQVRNARVPVIVFVSESPALHNRFAPEIQFLVNLGYFVIVPELPSANATADPAALHRITDAAGWLKTNPYVDPQKVIAVGVGPAATLVLSALGSEPSRWSAGLIVGPWRQQPITPPPTPLPSLSAQPLAGSSLAAAQGLPLVVAADAASLADTTPKPAAKPLLLAPPETARIAAPLFLAGDASLQSIADAARPAGIKVELNLYEHSGRANRADAWRRAAAFLKFHVPAPGCGCSIE